MVEPKTYVWCPSCHKEFEHEEFVYQECEHCGYPEAPPKKWPDNLTEKDFEDVYDHDRDWDKQPFDIDDLPF
jgi:hypothetical protein